MFHLDFYGNTTWIYRHSNVKNFDPKKWEALTAVRTKDSISYPPGSEWAKIELPMAPQQTKSHFKELVQVPEDIETGDKGRIHRFSQ